MIAIVDDDPSVRRGLERLLRAAGYTVAGYASGAEFLQALGHTRPKYVVLDLHMPQIDGFGVLTALAKEQQQIPAIVVTADQDPQTAVRVKRLGGTACLTKPVDETVLLELIEAALQS